MTVPLLAQSSPDGTRPLEAFLDAVNAFYRRVLFLPDQASTTARSIDELHYLEITSMFMAAAVIALALFVFLIRFRRRQPVQRTRRIVASTRAEVVLYGSLFALFVFYWVLGFRQYVRLTVAPAGAIDVYVTSRQWLWEFAHPDGPASVGVLYVPAQRPIRLLLTSRDVIHSFFVPAFRIKRDAVPGTYTEAWFEAKVPGTYPILCAELCGVGHSMMRAQVVVLSPQDFENWLRGRPPAAVLDTLNRSPYLEPLSELEPLIRLADRGRAVAARRGCLQCHTTDGGRATGPTWLDLFGSSALLTTGERVPVDEAYITRSMMEPGAQMVAGFANDMPSYLGLITPAETAAIIEYMKSLSTVR
jgi:cytochrome c oxidase subunit 2